MDAFFSLLGAFILERFGAELWLIIYMLCWMVGFKTKIGLGYGIRILDSVANFVDATEEEFLLCLWNLGVNPLDYRYGRLLFAEERTLVCYHWRDLVWTRAAFFTAIKKSGASFGSYVW